MNQLTIKVGDTVQFRGNTGKVINVSDKSIQIYCASKGRVPYQIGVQKDLFYREGQIL